MIYITCSDPEEAGYIGRHLVEEQYVACINVITGMESIYWWQGEVCQDKETVLIAKTVAQKVESLVERVREMHSYDLPCIVSLPILEGNPEYLQWISESLLPR